MRKGVREGAETKKCGDLDQCEEGCEEGQDDRRYHRMQADVHTNMHTRQPRALPFTSSASAPVTERHCDVWHVVAFAKASLI